MADGQVATVEPREVALDQPADALSIIAQAARDPNTRHEVIDALARWKHQEEDREEKRAFIRAFVAAKKEIKPIFKNQNNSQTKSKYADLLALADAIDPILEKHGLSPTFGTEPCDRPGFYRMTCDLMHEDGHEKHYVADIPEDKTGIKGTVNKTDTHAFGSSMSYGRRYMKLMMFDVATTDDDGNAAGHSLSGDTLTEDQVKTITESLKTLGTSEDKFLSWCASKGYGATEIGLLPIERFDAINKQLAHWINQKGANNA